MVIRLIMCKMSLVRELLKKSKEKNGTQDSDGNNQPGEDAEKARRTAEKLSETELNQALPATKRQTEDEEKYLKLLDVMEQFKNHMIAGVFGPLALEEGETLLYRLQS